MTLWKNAYGQTAVGDADNDGDSDGADFLVWQRNFAPAAPVAAIPEPASLALLLTAAAGILAARKVNA